MARWWFQVGHIQRRAALTEMHLIVVLDFKDQIVGDVKPFGNGVFLECAADGGNARLLCCH